jgi:hypothetical protein
MVPRRDNGDYRALGLRSPHVTLILLSQSRGAVQSVCCQAPALGCRPCPNCRCRHRRWLAYEACRLWRLARCRSPPGHSSSARPSRRRSSGLARCRWHLPRSDGTACRRYSSSSPGRWRWRSRPWRSGPGHDCRCTAPCGSGAGQTLQHPASLSIVDVRRGEVVGISRRQRSARCIAHALIHYPFRLPMTVAPAVRTKIRIDFCCELCVGDQ